jgi:hypothetical protein
MTTEMTTMAIATPIESTSRHGAIAVDCCWCVDILSLMSDSVVVAPEHQLFECKRKIKKKVKILFTYLFKSAIETFWSISRITSSRTRSSLFQNLFKFIQKFLIHFSKS